MKKLFGQFTFLLLILLFLLSCAPSVSKIEYDNVVNNLASMNSQNQSLQTALSMAQSQVQSLQTNLSSAESQIKLVQADLSTLQSQNKSLQTDLSSGQSQIQSLQKDLSSAQAQSLSAEIKIRRTKLRIEILNMIFLPSFKGQQLSNAESLALFLDWRDKVNASGDAQLISKFQSVVDNFDNPILVELALTEFFIYLLESIENVLDGPTKGV